MGITIRYIRLILVSVIALFVMLTAISWFFPSHVRISRAINIAAPRGKVFAAVNELRSWDSWNEFIRATPLTGKSLSSPSAGKGAALRSDQLRVTITESGPDSLIMDWQQSRGKRFKGGFNLLQLSADSLTVQWWFDFHFRWYPWEKMGSLVYDQQLGPVMEESLAGLKRWVESGQ
jgi:Polyketide cyclase / dehydrase and lipid transport